MTQAEFDNNILTLCLGLHGCVKDVRCETDLELETQTVKARDTESMTESQRERSLNDTKRAFSISKIFTQIL